MTGTTFGSGQLGQHYSDCTLDLDVSIRIHTKWKKPHPVISKVSIILKKYMRLRNCSGTIKTGTTFGSCRLGQHYSDCTLDLDVSIRIHIEWVQAAPGSK